MDGGGRADLGRDDGSLLRWSSPEGPKGHGRRLVAAILVAAGLVVSACGSGTASSAASASAGGSASATATQAAAASGTSASTSSQAKYPIKYSTQWNPGFSAVLADQYFASQIAKVTNGQVQAKLYLDGVLGGAPGTLKGVENGSIQMGVVATSWLADAVPQFGALSLPFLFASPQAAYSALNGGKAGATLAQEALNKLGIRILAWYNVGSGIISTTHKAVHTPADLVGMRIRTLSDPIEINTYKAWGAVPVPLNNTEVFTSLQSGAVAGVTIPASAVIADKYAQLVKYATLIDDEAFPAVVIINEKYFESLPPTIQKAIESVEVKAAAQDVQFAAAAHQKSLATLRKDGVQLIQPTPSQMAEFKKAVAPVLAAAQKQFGQQFMSELSSGS